MSVRAVDHIGFAVSDLARSIEFYSKLLEVKEYFDEVYDVEYIGRVVGYPGAIQHAAFFKLPGQETTFLELIQYLNPVSVPVDMARYNAGNAHLCLECDDLEAEAVRLIAIGATPVGDTPTTSDYGIYAGARTMYFLDPDDISLQIVELSGTSYSAS